MKKSLFTAIAVGLGLTAKLMAQVPSYVPTNGLVGWWPFNGNANDESGNGNNGTVNGATLTADRFGNNSKSYSFDGANDFIDLGTSINFSNYTFSGWINYSQIPTDILFAVISKISNNFSDAELSIRDYEKIVSAHGTGTTWEGVESIQLISMNQWVYLTATYDGSILKLYINGILESTTNVSNYYNSNGYSVFIGARPNNQGIDVTRFYMNGKIDDVGIWNRALTQQEISSLVNGCPSNGITTQPNNAINSIGANAQFSINALPGSTYQWQSNPLNIGWLDLSNNSTYSGSTTNTLTVSNVQLSNHNQPFRVIASSGNCTDTSNVATIQIADTCITNVIVYDTLLTTVTDTLVINTTLSLPAPNNENTILIYPNPASDHITIDNGNYLAMAGYSIKIENNAGQQVFQSAINQQQFYVDLSTWSGNGLYFVHLIDPQNNTVTVRKIVLQ
jgi:hypothetical protein